LSDNCKEVEECDCSVGGKDGDVLLKVTKAKDFDKQLKEVKQMVGGLTEDVIMSHREEPSSSVRIPLIILD